PLYRHARDAGGIGVALHNLGLAYSDLGNPQHARALLEQALALARRVGARDEQERTLVDLARAYEAAGRRTEALACYQQALEIEASVHGSLRGLATSQMEYAGKN